MNTKVISGGCTREKRNCGGCMACVAGNVLLLNLAAG